MSLQQHHNDPQQHHTLHVSRQVISVQPNHPTLFSEYWRATIAHVISPHFWMCGKQLVIKRRDQCLDIRHLRYAALRVFNCVLIQHNASFPCDHFTDSNGIFWGNFSVRHPSLRGQICKKQPIFAPIIGQNSKIFENICVLANLIPIETKERTHHEGTFSCIFHADTFDIICSCRRMWQPRKRHSNAV